MLSMVQHKRGVFVAGTDTGVGKTLVATGLLTQFQHAGLSALPMKPVATGCVEVDRTLISEDAVQLMTAALRHVRYELVNPYAYQAAIAPNIAAIECGPAIELSKIDQARHALLAEADVLVVEGTGGWLTPIDAQRTMADIAAMLGYPVVLVVGMRLGCLNHALLTARSIASSGLDLAGWVANSVPPGMVRLDENIKTLKDRLNAPLLGHIPPLPKPDPAEVAAHLGWLGMRG